jgi:hypothetical protein
MIIELALNARIRVLMSKGFTTALYEKYSYKTAM